MRWTAVAITAAPASTCAPVRARRQRGWLTRGRGLGQRLAAHASPTDQDGADDDRRGEHQLADHRLRVSRSATAKATAPVPSLRDRMSARTIGPASPLPVPIRAAREAPAPNQAPSSRCPASPSSPASPSPWPWLPCCSPPATSARPRPWNSSGRSSWVISIRSSAICARAPTSTSPTRPATCPSTWRPVWVRSASCTSSPGTGRISPPATAPAARPWSPPCSTARPRSPRH